MEDGTNQTPPFTYPPQANAPLEPPAAPQPSPNNNPYTAAPLPPASPTGPVVPPAVYTPVSRKWWQRPGVKITALIIGAVLLLGGGSAAAYFAVVVPGKPANVLKKSLQNSLQQEKVTAKGTLEYTAGEGGSLLSNGNSSSDNSKISVDYTLQVDGTTDNSALEAKLKFNGKSFPFELRSVDKTGYLKLGDISELLSGVGAVSPQLQQLVAAVDGAVSNQWISFKNDQSKALNCFGTFPDTKQSKEEFVFLEKTFKNNQFAKVTSTSKDKVDGKNAIKYTISFDENKGRDFMERLKERPRYKELLKCLGAEEEIASNTKQLSAVRDMVGLKAATSLMNQKSGSSTSSSSDSVDNVSLQLWVDSSKKVISKMQIDTSSLEGKVVATANLEYGQAKIDKPDKSKTVEELIKEIGPTIEQIAPDLQSWLSGFTDANSDTGQSPSASTGSARNTERQTDIKAIHGQLEAFSAQEGHYPTLANLNDANWRATNMKGLDKAALIDPQGSAASLVATPAKNIYSYQVTTDEGRACTNQNGNDCTKYTLTATYEGQVNGQSTYVKNNL